MNYIDLGIAVIFVFFVLLGYYEGFLQSVFSVVAFFLSWLGAAVGTHWLSAYLRSFDKVYDALLYYAEGAEMLKSVEHAKLNITRLYADELSSIISQSSIPSPVDNIVAKNIASEAFKEFDIVTLGDYVNRTIVNYTINIISFVIIFFVIRLILEFIIKGVDAIKPLPVLAHFDSVLSSGVSLVRAFFAVFVIFMAVPIVLLLLPSGGTFSSSFVRNYIDESFFGSFFYNSNFLLSLISGV